MCTLMICMRVCVRVWNVQFSHSVVSDSLWPHEPQHTKPPCPSPTPGVHPKPCPLYWWCHPTISSSVLPFSSCPQCFPASGSFQMSQLFTSGGQSTGVSPLASVLPMNTQDWYLLGWTCWISLQSKGLLRVSSNKNHQFFGTQLSLEKEMATHSSILAWKIPQTEKPGQTTVHVVTKSRTQLKWLNTHTTAFFIVQLSHPYMTYWKNHSFDQTDLCW